VLGRGVEGRSCDFSRTAIWCAFVARTTYLGMGMGRPGGTLYLLASTKNMREGRIQDSLHLPTWTSSISENNCPKGYALA
jgi:hypothetical protein